MLERHLLQSFAHAESGDGGTGNWEELIYFKDVEFMTDIISVVFIDILRKFYVCMVVSK